MKKMASSATSGLQTYNLDIQLPLEPTTLQDEERNNNSYWLHIAQEAMQSRAGSIRSSAQGGSIQVFFHSVHIQRTSLFLCWALLCRYISRSTKYKFLSQHVGGSAILSSCLLGKHFWPQAVKWQQELPGLIQLPMWAALPWWWSLVTLPTIPLMVTCFCQVL